MSSPTRKQLEAWLQTLEISGSVLDVGGIHMPIKGRTKTWDVNKYEILDARKELYGVTTDFVWDLNRRCDFVPEYDNVFCIEVLSHIYDPMTVMNNLYRFLKPGGRLFLSVHTMFPQHSGLDCLRYTKVGITTLLNKAKLELVQIIPKLVKYPPSLIAFSLSESPVDRAPGEIGYLIEAKK